MAGVMMYLVTHRMERSYIYNVCVYNEAIHTHNAITMSFIINYLK